MTENPQVPAEDHTPADNHNPAEEPDVTQQPDPSAGGGATPESAPEAARPDQPLAPTPPQPPAVPASAPVAAPTAATTQLPPVAQRSELTPAPPVYPQGPPPPQHTGEAFRAPASSSPKRKAAVGLVAALAVGALIGGVSGAGATMWAISNTASAPVVGNASPTTITVNDTKSVNEITAVAAKASPSVVTISVASSNSGGTGSGIILSKDGYVLTNTHVVTLDGAAGDTSVKVTTNDGRLLNATIVGTDPISDLAVLKIDGVDDLQPAEFADSSDLNVGDTAIAIGAPLGLAGTVTNGIVSALNRSITIASSAVPDTGDQAPDPQQDPYGLFNFDLPGQTPNASSSSTIALSVIQTDAAINPGNSGGALLDSDGKIIGVNVAIASAGGSSASSQAGSIGVGFAIPANLAQRVADEIIATGSATHGLLGASVGDVTDEATSSTESQVVGAVVKEISAGGAAAAGGLQVGDVITKLDGIPVTGKTDLTAQVRALAAGASATVTYVRDGKAAQADVTLGELQ
ncbi:putative serine protease PepD [Salinibacterium sp. CAN_S4]|uniref:S1C family serine protease n=1 Tax=Salinibacterium sp. CAN_S4 TaxID=2787727 RepID=UPI001A26D49D